MKLARKAIGIPFARYHWAAAEDAHNAEDWKRVVYHLEKMHAWRWRTDNSHFLLGTAYAKLERYEEAVHELREIKKTLNLSESEQVRWLNLAISLGHLGDHDGAYEVLSKGIIRERFPDYAEAASELLDTARYHRRAAARDS